MNEVKTNYVPEKEETYSIGDCFVLKKDRKMTTVMLCQTDVGMVSLINLEDGNRYKDAIPVNRVDSITGKEIYQMYFGSVHDALIKVTKVSIEKV